VPEVAVTVMVDVTGCELADDPDVAPPHPVNRAKPKTPIVSISSIPRRFFQPNSHTTAASAEPGSHNIELPRTPAVDLVVVTVSVEVILPAGVTVADEKLHAAPLGRPEQVSVTFEFDEKPFSGVTVTVSVPLCPVITVNDAGDIPSVKSAVGLPAVVVALACVDGVELPSASTASTT
jgi:hypothetical protein